MVVLERDDNLSASCLWNLCVGAEKTRLDLLECLFRTFNIQTSNLSSFWQSTTSLCWRHKN